MSTGESAGSESEQVFLFILLALQRTMKGRQRAQECRKWAKLYGKSCLWNQGNGPCVLVQMDAHYNLSTSPGPQEEETKFSNPVLWEGTRARSGG